MDRIPDFKTYIGESAWGDMMRRSSGEMIRREDDINNLSFDEFVEYLKNTYTSTVDPKFFQIGSWYTPGNDKLGHISIPIEKNNSKDTPNFRNRMIDIVEDTQRDEFEIRLNKYFFRLYPNEMVKTFKDKYSWVKRNDNIYDIYPIGEEITNQICVDVIDRLLSMVENPILKKNS